MSYNAYKLHSLPYIIITVICTILMGGCDESGDSGGKNKDKGFLSLTSTGVDPIEGNYSFNQEGCFNIAYNVNSGKKFVNFATDCYNFRNIEIKNGNFYYEWGQIGGTHCPEDAFIISGSLVSETRVEGTIKYGYGCKIQRTVNFIAQTLWGVKKENDTLQIFYRNSSDLVQYATLNLKNSYFRMRYTANGQLGTSVILFPSFWSEGTYYQGAPLTASWIIDKSKLTISIEGIISSLNIKGSITIAPPEINFISAEININTSGNILLDNRPNESFKPVMLSSMHISGDIWYAQSAYIGYQSIQLPMNGWIVHAPITSDVFSLQGGNSNRMANIPTIEIKLDKSLEITGFVVPGDSSDNDNIGFWAAAYEVIPSWQYSIIARQSGPPLPDILLEEAKQLAQQTFTPYNLQGIVELDAPSNGNKRGLGLVFEEYNAIKGDKYFDNHIFAFEARPRGNVYRYPLKVINRNISPAQDIDYIRSHYDYSAWIIQPLLFEIPKNGQYIAGLQVSHLKSVSPNSFPAILIINSDGYLRLTAEPPRSFGTSYRVATHNVGRRKEDFPRIIKVATEAVDARAKFSLLIDSEAFSGYLFCELIPGIESIINVKATFIMRRDLNYSKEKNTGFVGLSSMFFRGRQETLNISSDQAHDADFFTITYSDKSVNEFALRNPSRIHLQDFNPPPGLKISSFALEQRDRDQAHYYHSDFASADYSSRSSLVIERISASIPFKITLQIFPTEQEYFENVVAHMTLLKNLKKSETVTLEYRVRAF